MFSAHFSVLRQAKSLFSLAENVRNYRWTWLKSLTHLARNNNNSNNNLTRGVKPAIMWNWFESSIFCAILVDCLNKECRPAKRVTCKEFNLVLSFPFAKKSKLLSRYALLKIELKQSLMTWKQLAYFVRRVSTMNEDGWFRWQSCYILYLLSYMWRSLFSFEPRGWWPKDILCPRVPGFSFSVGFILHCPWWILCRPRWWCVRLVNKTFLETLWWL